MHFGQGQKKGWGRGKLLNGQQTLQKEKDAVKERELIRVHLTQNVHNYVCYAEHSVNVFIIFLYVLYFMSYVNAPIRVSRITVKQHRP